MEVKFFPITLVVLSEEGQRFEGIKPDIEEIKKGNDGVLKQAIEYLNKK